jgi:non-homologous end joining protein Ku
MIGDGSSHLEASTRLAPMRSRKREQRLRPVARQIGKGHLVDTKSAQFDPSTFMDHYDDAVLELLKQKEAGRPIGREPDGCSAPER